MNIGWCTINVKNMDESLKFYQEVLGMDIDRRFSGGPGMDIAFLGKGETKIELISGQTPQPNIGEDISLGFEVESLDETLEFIKKKGIEIHSGPIEPNPMVRFFFVQDPNGLKIQFAQHL